MPIPANRSDAAAVVTASSKTMPGAPARADTSKPKMHGGDTTSGDVPKVPTVPASSKTMPGTRTRADMLKPKMHGGDTTSGDVPKVPTVPASSKTMPGAPAARVKTHQSQTCMEETKYQVMSQKYQQYLQAVRQCLEHLLPEQTDQSKRCMEETKHQVMSQKYQQYLQAVRQCLEHPLPEQTHQSQRCMEETKHQVMSQKYQQYLQVARMQSNLKQPLHRCHIFNQKSIDLTGKHISPEMKPSWIPAFNLLEEDKNILLHGQKLTDKHICACQKLLKKQFPQVDGLLDTILRSNNDIPCPPTQEALQMHHIPGHWVISCSFGGNVTVYDSANTTLTPPLQRQLARVYSLLASGPDKLIEVTLKRCQKQIGGNDFGLFAVANAIALLRGVDPATVKFQQPKMRQHLQECREKHVLTMFPHSTSNPTTLPTVSRKEIVSLHCFCKKHYPGSKTFQCSSCKVTFHTMCVKHNSVNRPHCTEDLCPPCQG